MEKIFHEIGFSHRQLLTIFSLASLAPALHASLPPPIAECQAEPVTYVGKDTTDRRFYDGAARHAVGVHSYQALRANRSLAPEGGYLGWTYNHAPMLSYWHGRFWMEYLSDVKEENGAPGRTLVLSSADGRRWSNPQIAFPTVLLPKIHPPARYFDGVQLPDVPAGTECVMHQRMGWYVAPDGRLLVIGFYSYCPNNRWDANRGQGLGRVVREIHPDGSFGPIYFVRYNKEAGWDESNVPYFPFFTASPDTGFVAACNALLANKLITAQWWEEDRAKDGFFTLDIPPGVEPKALSFFERPDGVTVGLWKSHHAALSPDHGQTWLPMGTHPFPEAASKIWGQRTSDDRYALVYNHSATERNRFPLVVVTSDDGHAFDHLLCVQGEVPPMRYQGIHKNLGPQYIRGIVPGNGTPSDGQLWVTYSMSKEDLWVSRIRVPVSGAVSEAVNDTFESPGETSLENWNLYVPQWAPITIVSDPRDPANHCLELRDADPYDYAKAERAFPESSRVAVSFRVLQERVGTAKLEIEVQGAHGESPLRLRFESDSLGFDHGNNKAVPAPMNVGSWHTVELRLDCAAGSYDAFLDGKQVQRALVFAAPVKAVERLVFRTGPYRNDVRSYIVNGEPGNTGLIEEDLPGADSEVPASAFLIDDVKTTGL